MMEICQRCGKEFDHDEEEDLFNMEYMLRSFDNFNETLCADCAGKVIDEHEEGVYFEYCDNCGKKYDPFVEESRFYDMLPEWDRENVDLDFFDKLLCADCAMEEYEKIPGPPTDED